MTFLLGFLIYFVIVFVVTYILVEYGHKYLYDEPPPLMFLRVAGGSLIMAAVLTWTKSSFDTMFTADLYKTVLLMVVWTGVYILALRYQPMHGAAFALAAALLVPGLATLAVQGATAPAEPERAATKPRTPIRSSSGVGTIPPPVEAKK